MEEFPKNTGKEQPPKVKISDEIREAFEFAEREGMIKEGEDVMWADFKRMKTEVRDTLAVAGLWSEEFGAWIDENLAELGGWGIALESVGKWMRREPGKLKEEQLRWYEGNAIRKLERYSLLTPAWEQWIKNGSPDDLERVGEHLNYMSRAFGLLGLKDFLEKDKTAASEKKASTRK